MSEKTDSESCSKPQITEGAPDNSKFVYGPKRWLVAFTLTLVMFLTLLDTTIVVTAIPEITTTFKSLSDVGWYGSAYLMACCALQPITGRIFTHFNLKYTFLTFLIVFEIGSAVCGAAHSSKMLIAGRTIAGLGGSGLRNGALTIVSESIPLDKRPPYFGVMMGISLLGTVGGPLIGGAFTSSVSWRWCFYINLPIGGLAALVLLLIQVPDNTSDQKPKTLSEGLKCLTKLDPVGFFLFAPVAVMLLMALEWGGSEYPWKSATIIGLFCGAGAMALVFLGWEYYMGNEAMIPFSMVKIRVVWSSCLFIWLLFGAMMVFSYYLPIYFQAVKGSSPLKSGVEILPLILSQLVASVVSGGLVRKIGYYLPFIVGCGILVTISAALVSTFQIDTSTGKWIGYQVIGGVGQGLGLQMPYVAVQNALSDESNAIALALLVFMQNFGGAILLAIAQALFSQKLTSGLSEFAPDVDFQLVEAAGATGFERVVPSEQIRGVRMAYNSAIRVEFYLAIASAAATLLFCWAMGWVNITKTKESMLSESTEDGDRRVEE